ncbi:Pyruvate dehydrogenase E1 component subunit alpha [Aphelenchoides bicaudatus]|nr:Pyruvate dehydrogenase E1 component subunit alpha [Aphelenchoides bicaudatus]
MFSKLSVVRSAKSINAVGARFLSTKREENFKTRHYKLFKLDYGPQDEVTITRDEALAYYRQMQVIRRLETTAGNLYKEKKVRGFCHLYTGQEAVAVGLTAAKHHDDAVITSYRCHGWTYLMGSTVTEVLAELTGRISGNVYGKGGSMHMYERNFYGGNGIVGAQIALGAGLALAMKYRNERNVSYTLYGDGAANQGQFFECVNMAKLWDLPVIFICENNGFGMGTSVERASASTDYYTRGDFVPGLWVDGMDVATVREGFRFAREYAIAKGPIVVEVATYRYSGHSMSDPGTSYRTREEVQEVRKHRDPITGFKDRIITAGLTDEEELKNIDKDVRKEVDEATTTATSDGVLPPEALYSDLFANTEPQTVRGCTVDETVVQPFTTTAEIIKKLGRTPKQY